MEINILFNFAKLNSIMVIKAKYNTISFKLRICEEKYGK